MVPAKTATDLYIANPGRYTESSYKNMNAGKICAWIGIIPYSLSSNDTLTCSFPYSLIYYYVLYANPEHVHLLVSRDTEHHKKQTFAEEYDGFIRFNIPYLRNKRIREEGG